MNSDKVGQHLIFDAHVEPEYVYLLSDAKFLVQFSKDLIERVGMDLLGDPLVNTVSCDESLIETENDEGGVSVVCQIKTRGHVWVDTWPLRHRFALDLFSCKDFNHGETKSFIRKKLHVTEHWMQTVQRFWPKGKFKVEKRTESSEIP